MVAEKKISRRDYLKYVASGVVGAGVAAALGYYFWTRPPPTPVKRAIKIGHSSSFTGVLATAEAICRMHYDLWTEMVNAEGGIYLEEYGERLPVTWVFYNDMAETEKNIRNTRRLIEDDKVDILYGSYGTFQSFAIEPVVNEYDVVCVAGNAGPALIEDPAEFERIYIEDDFYRDEAGRPWYEWEKEIWVEMHRYFHMEALFKVLREVGVSDVIIWEIGTLYGIESRRNLIRLLEYDGIDVLSRKEYPMGMRDFTGLVEEAKTLNPDAILQFSYPDDGMAAINDMIEKDYNPNLYYNALGSTSNFAYEKFGENLEGIMYHGTAFPKSPMSQSDWGSGLHINDKFIERYGERPDMIDGSLAFGSVQVAGELIKRAGTLDRKAIYDEILKTKDKPIPTVCGPISWHKGPWPQYPGMVGQLIGIGEVPMGHDSEVVAAAFGEHAGLGLKYTEGDYVTAKPVYPKPKWKK